MDWGASCPHSGSSLWLCTLPGALFSADSQCPHLPRTWVESVNHSSPESSGLHGLANEDGSLQEPSVLDGSFHHPHSGKSPSFLRDWFTLSTSELCAETKFLRSLRSLKNKWGYAKANRLSPPVLNFSASEIRRECCPSDHHPPYSWVLFSSILLPGALILLSVSWIKGLWGNSTSLQTPELCLLYSATENRSLSQEWWEMEKL